MWGSILSSWGCFSCCGVCLRLLVRSWVLPLRRSCWLRGCGVSPPARSASVGVVLRGGVAALAVSCFGGSVCVAFLVVVSAPSWRLRSLCRWFRLGGVGRAVGGSVAGLLLLAVVPLLRLVGVVGGWLLRRLLFRRLALCRCPLRCFRGRFVLRWSSALGSLLVVWCCVFGFSSAQPTKTKERR